jgi:hypothetical protein
MPQITVRHDSGGYRATCEGIDLPDWCYGWGHTPDAAVGNFVLAFQSTNRLGITVSIAIERPQPLDGLVACNATEASHAQA